MSKFAANKTFKSGFNLGIILFLFAQVFSFLIYFISTITRTLKTPSGISIHSFWDIGFPFSMYSGMYDIFHGEINFNGILGNILVGTIFSIIVGLIFKFRGNLRGKRLSLL